MTSINQKEYLKRYLAIGKAPGEKRKKKKIKSSISNRVKIVDDDADANAIDIIQDEDPFHVSEDAPQIVAIIDERPPSLRVDEKTKSSLWQPIGVANEDGNRINEQKEMITGFKIANPIKDMSEDNRDRSPPRRKKPSSSRHTTRVDNSPPRRNKSVERSRSEVRVKREVEEESKKMTRTLDGKKAGLSNAKHLTEETSNLRLKEDELFKNLPKEVSGENAEVNVRKTGKIKNVMDEYERHKKKHEEEQKNKEKYSRWGRGLVQVESRERKIEDELYEMSKPLARYADDKDLEKYLKEQEREGDPMLAYIRKKKRKEAVKSGHVFKPQFEGEFMPNRFGIRPGHRWDGVDRSNGYEKKWFEVQNSRRAQQEESYKWSTEDM